VSTLLERLTFGTTASDLSDWTRLGAKGWLEQQLSPTKEDSRVEEALQGALLRISYGASAATPTDYPAVNENRALSSLTQTTQQLWPLADNKRKIANEERVRPLREAAASKRCMHVTAVGNCVS
jgi:hypothetical protein